MWIGIHAVMRSRYVNRRQEQFREWCRAAGLGWEVLRLPDQMHGIGYEQPGWVGKHYVCRITCTAQATAAGFCKR